MSVAIRTLFGRGVQVHSSCLGGDPHRRGVRRGLRNAVEAELSFYLGVESRRRGEGSKPKLGADEVEGLPQVAGLKQEDPIGTSMVVLPHVPAHCCRHEEDRGGVTNPFLVRAQAHDEIFESSWP